MNGIFKEEGNEYIKKSEMNIWRRVKGINKDEWTEFLKKSQMNI